MHSIVFAFLHKNQISTKAFFYLLCGGMLPKLRYTTHKITPHRSYYLQSYLKNGRFRLRVLDSYFKAPKLDGLLLATKRFSKGVPVTMEDFYFETLEALAYYAV